MQYLFIIKLLDIIHDYFLHPLFKDGDDVDLSKIEAKLNEIQKQIQDLKNGNKS